MYCAKKKNNKKIILDKNKTFAIKKLQLDEASYTQNRQIVTEYYNKHGH